MKSWHVLVMAGWLGLCCCAAPASPRGCPGEGQPAGYRAARGVGRICAADLHEISGLAASRRMDGVLWAVNDSGNAPHLFALGLQGQALGELRIKGVENIDWEDLASFTWRNQPYLLIADVGDNRGLRPEVLLHAVPEPAPGADGRFTGEVSPAWSIRLRYEDGPRDCEGVAVDSQVGLVLLLSKRTDPPVFYQVPLLPSEPGRLQVARRLVEMGSLHLTGDAGRQTSFIPRPWPTALDIRADGGAMVILTYREALLYRKDSRQSWADAMARAPQVLALPSLDLLPQPEAIAFDRDNALYLTSEGRGSTLFRMDAEKPCQRAPAAVGEKASGLP